MKSSNRKELQQIVSTGQSQLLRNEPQEMNKKLMSNSSLCSLWKKRILMQEEKIEINFVGVKQGKGY